MKRRCDLGMRMLSYMYITKCSIIFLLKIFSICFPIHQYFYVTLNHSWGFSIGPGSRFVHFPIFTISGCLHRNLTNCSRRVLWTYNKKNYGIETLFFFCISASVITLRINENISIELLLFTLIQIYLPFYKTNNFNLDWVYQYNHWTHFHTLSIAEVSRIVCVYCLAWQCWSFVQISSMTCLR